MSDDTTLKVGDLAMYQDWPCVVCSIGDDHIRIRKLVDPEQHGMVVSDVLSKDADVRNMAKFAKDWITRNDD